MRIKIFHTKLFRILFLTVCVLVAIGIIRSVVTIWQKRGIVAERKAVLQAEEAKNSELERRLIEATSAAFIERVAREKLGLVKEGETVVILDKSRLDSASSSGNVTHQIPLWKRWWQLFF